MTMPAPERDTSPPQGPPTPQDMRRHALVIALELTKNAVRAGTRDDVQFILVNDTRALLPFDRASLLLHVGGKSEAAAINNQPKVENKAEIVQRLNELAVTFKDVDNVLVVFPDKIAGVSNELEAKLRSYMELSGCSSMVVLPLVAYEIIIGHLVFEFFGDVRPDEMALVALANMSPLLAQSLSEKVFFDREPAAKKRFFRSLSHGSAAERSSKTRLRALLGVAALVLLVALLAMPVTLKIGGKAEAAPDYEYAAFVEMEGIIEQVLVKEGDRVAKGQVVALLDSKELDYKTREAQRLLESYEKEAQILRSQGAENPAKLAESQLTLLKSQRARQDLDFLTWQRQFLEIRSPVDGIILTKRVETSIGKKFKPGEIFCKIAPHDFLVVEVFVRESDVAFVTKNDPGEVYFNYDPGKGHSFVVDTVAPKAESVERLGSVFRVRGLFAEQPAAIKPGMSGIAHISAKKASAWFVITRRLRSKISELLLYL